MVGVAQAAATAELSRIPCAAKVATETAAHAARRVAGGGNAGRKLSGGDGVRVAAGRLAPDVGVGGFYPKLSVGEETGATALNASPVDEQGVASDSSVDCVRVDTFEGNVGNLAS